MLKSSPVTAKSSLEPVQAAGAALRPACRCCRNLNRPPDCHRAHRGSQHRCFPTLAVRRGSCSPRAGHGERCESAVSANDRECSAQKCKGTDRLSGINLGRRHSTTTLIVLPLIVIVLALVVLTECSSGSKGQQCHEERLCNCLGHVLTGHSFRRTRQGALCQ